MNIKLIIFLLNTITYYGSCLIFYFLDKYLIEKNLWNKYKYQKYKGTNNFYKSKIYKIWMSCLKTSIINSLFSIILIYISNFNTTLYQISDIYKLPLYALYAETHFYFFHRLFHTKYLYFLHKKHHETHITIAASANNASVLEHVLVNVGELFVANYLFQGSILLTLIAILFGTVNPILSHCGYLNFGIEHEIHHIKLSKNYGFGLYIWDRLFGTFKKI